MRYGSLAYVTALVVIGYAYASTRDLTLASRRQGHPVEWLHIPKTGTSFGNTLLLWACPELNTTLWITASGVADLPAGCKAKFYLHPGNRKEWFVGDHTSLENRSDDQLKNVFTFVRSPMTKIASGYHFIQSVMLQQSTTNVTEADICAFARKSTVAHMALGAQVKTIAGNAMTVVEREYPSHEFGSAEPPTSAEIELACARLHSFAFVGITELWAASICLFHNKFGGRAHAVEHVNVNRGRYHSDGSITRVDCSDNADATLFRCALSRFFAELSNFPDCMTHLNADLEVIL